ncbi:MAG: RsmE family RNA methyltransferase [Proteobacteria bacterium]|nr:RsmE family RNA methyltransferase [Pseudomonadota bacterium]
MVVFDGCGGEYPARISKISTGRVEVTLSEPRHPPTESPVDITLAQGLIRGERMDLVLQKATELGVSRIVPVAMERCVTRLSRRGWQKECSIGKRWSSAPASNAAARFCRSSSLCKAARN